MTKKKNKSEELDQYDFPFSEDDIISAKGAEYAREIGEFLISFSNLESSLNLLVAEAINDRSHDLGYSVIKSLTYHNKAKLAKDLYLQPINLIPKDNLKKKYKNEFDLIFSKLSELGEFRNKIVHANWVTLDKDNYVRTKVVQDDLGTINFVKIKITPRLISRFASQCDQFAGRVSRFHDKVYGSL